MADFNVSVTLNPPITHYTVTEGVDTIGPITCQSDCNPPCEHKWSTIMTPILEFRQINR